MSLFFYKVKHFDIREFHLFYLSYSNVQKKSTVNQIKISDNTMFAQLLYFHDTRNTFRVVLFPLVASWASCALHSDLKKVSYYDFFNLIYRGFLLGNLKVGFKRRKRFIWMLCLKEG